MRHLTTWSGGLVGERDPAQPLLTLHDGSGRVELSGATTANWVAKTANLLTDGLGGPATVGLLLPLHWQTLVALLGGVATGATVVVAGDPAGLGGCDAAFTTGEDAEAVLAAGVEEVLAVSLHPLGAPLPSVPPLVLDHAREVPGHADHWAGGPVTPRVQVDGAALPPLPALGLDRHDRVVVALHPGVAQELALLLACLHEGAALVLVPAPQRLDVAATAAAESATATAGVSVPGLRRLG